MATNRIYVVTETGTSGAPRLIRATYRATAVRHAAAERFAARIATHDDLEKLITSGIRVEHADETPDAFEAAQLP